MLPSLACVCGGSGFRSSQSYLGLKWGCDKETQEVCVFEHPFNDPSLPASYWRLDWKR